MANIVPYGGYAFGSAMIPQTSTEPLHSGESMGLHIHVAAEHLAWLLASIERWFDERDDVILVGSGLSGKLGRGFIVLEWDGCAIDRLFLDILRSEEVVHDYDAYVISSEVL